MPTQNVETFAVVGVFDTTANAWKTGDAANITLKVIADGTSGSISGAVSEVDATNQPGRYKVTIAAGENTGLAMEVSGKTATANCMVIPDKWDNLPAAGVTLTSAYDAAKSAAAAGAQMDLVNAPNGTAVTAIQSGLSTLTAEEAADAVWDEASTGHTDAGKAGAAIWTTVPGIATVLSGITSLAAWLRGLARKDAMDGTAKSELNSGGGGYNETTDSQEALDATLAAMKGASWTDETLVSIQTAAEAATAPTVGEIDTQLSNTHGAGTWGGAAGSGTRTVTVTVQTSGGTVYANVPVTCNNQSETGTAYTINTNSLGQAVFYLADGAWRAIAAGTNLQSGGATNFTVDGTETVTVTVTAVTVPATTSPDNYLIYNYERKVEADAAFGASGVTVEILELSPTVRSDATANAQRSVYGTTYSTDANGLWSVEIAKACDGGTLRLRKTWTDADGTTSHVEEWSAKIDGTLANGSDQIAWADLSPTLKSKR